MLEPWERVKHSRMLVKEVTDVVRNNLRISSLQKGTRKSFALISKTQTQSKTLRDTKERLPIQNGRRRHCQ